MSEQTGDVVVVGQGYVGLPLAMRAVDVGMRCTGIDLDQLRTRQLSAGRSYVEDVSDKQLQRALASGRYTASSSYADAAGFRIAIITVPTPLRDGLPDLTMIEAAARDLGPHLTHGALVVLESTTYPGTTEELVAPLLEKGSGLSAGTEFYLGYSPERIDPGNTTWTLLNTPKVVSGINPPSRDKTTAFYRRIVEYTVEVSSCRVAELTKLLENTFRHVNIALVNELAIFAHELGINVWEAIDAASTKPFGFMPFTPGPGVGGHCLPIDPSYLSWQVKRALGRNFRFVELANDINDHMPDYVVSRAAKLLNESRRSIRGSTVLLLGLAYKKNSSDARGSPAIRVGELLSDLGANVLAIDPHVDHHQVPSAIRLVRPTATALRNADLVILLTDHDKLIPLLSASPLTQILDTRNCLPERVGVEPL